MKHLVYILTIVVIILSFCGSCYYDNEESLYPSIGKTCDTTNVTYSKDIVPLLSNNCLACHSNSSAPSSGGGIALEDYPDVKANTTRISGAINHSGGYSPMPKNGGKLNSCLISQFDIWVRNGAPNN